MRAGFTKRATKLLHGLCHLHDVCTKDYAHKALAESERWVHMSDWSLGFKAQGSASVRWVMHVQQDGCRADEDGKACLDKMGVMDT